MHETLYLIILGIVSIYGERITTFLYVKVVRHRTRRAVKKQTRLAAQQRRKGTTHIPKHHPHHPPVDRDE